jgi:hypothetical protein
MSKQANRDSPIAPLAVGFFIGVITVGTIVLVWNHDSPSRSRSSIPTYAASTSSGGAPATIGSAVMRVAARFACSCGTCGEKRLDICSCETAQTERAFIEEQLRNGRSEAEAADALNQKYGGLKSGPS